MSFKYENERDAQQHLLGTVVMYAGAPAYVHEIAPSASGAFVVSLGHLPRYRNIFQVDLFDGQFEPRGIRLGYCNIVNAGRATFLSRIPSRQYHQGLHRTNLRIPEDETGRRHTNFEHLLTDAGFADCLRNIYPSYKEALNLLENPNILSAAFHRYFAVSKDELGFYRMHNRGIPVAYGGADKIILADKYEYLREQLTELGIKVA